MYDISFLIIKQYLEKHFDTIQKNILKLDEIKVDTNRKQMVSS